MPFGLASSQCAAVAQARIVRLHPTPPCDIPCSRARAGPLRDAARHRPPEENHSHVSTTERVLATLIDAFGLASSQCAAVAQRPSAHCEAPSHPPSDIPCSRARAGPLRDAARHRPPEKNHSHVSRVRHAPPLPRGWALTSFCPTPLSVAAPAHLSRSPRTAGPLSKPASTPTASTRYARAVAAKQGPAERTAVILLTCVLRRVLSIITGY